MAQVFPVTSILEELMDALKAQRQVILAAPPGAGKSTIVPLAILKQAGLSGTIIMLEPRRLAARHIANFLASQLGEMVGEQVGYVMRGDSQRSHATRLLVVTEGVLVRMLQEDPALEKTSLVIFDEFHERSLSADLGLALVQDACELNEQLNILVMSATIDTQALQQTLPESQLLLSQGRSFPIDYDYAPSTQPLAVHCAQEITQALQHDDGSILVFLPGVREIRQVLRQLESYSLPDGVSIHPLFGQLTLEEQRQAIVPTEGHARKIVLATNIAETSLTIEGITLVIDSGLERQAVYHPRSGVTRLMTRMICQSSAEQRAGRAGRLAPGRCIRLYSQEQMSHRPKYNMPQILRSDLSDLLFEIKCWGAQIDELNWVDTPAQSGVKHAERLLQLLGLVDEQGILTKSGQQVSHWQVSARSGALLVKAQQLEDAGETGALARGIFLAAVLENQLPRSSCSQLSDALHKQPIPARQLVKRQVKMLQSLFAHPSVMMADEHPLDGLLLASAFVDRIAWRRDEHRYQLVNGFAVRSTAIHAPWIVALELGWQETTTEGSLYLAVPISLDSLRFHYPQWFNWQSHVSFDESRQSFMGESQQRMGALVIERKSMPLNDEKLLSAGWLKEIRQRSLDWLPINEPAQAFRQRVLWLSHWAPHLELPKLDEGTLLDSLEDWLAPYLTGITHYKKLRSLDWLAIFQALFSYHQLQQIEQQAPRTYRAPSGRKVPIYYQLEVHPRISLKLQEMFGQPQTPTIAGGVAITIELLSPAGRVLQLTQDLASFWQDAYPQVRKEGRGRYPKHPWPEDPIDYEPTHKTKRQLQR